MAGLSLEIDWRVKQVAIQLAQEFPNLERRSSGYVATRAKTILKKKYLSGQELDYTTPFKDKIGRPTVSSKYFKRRKETAVYSYPLNFFEHGRTLRDGSTEAGKKILTVKLKGDIEARLPQYNAEIEQKILQPVIDKVGL